MFAIFNVPSYILRKNEGYYTGGFSVWSPCPTFAIRFTKHEAARARELLRSSENITIEQAA